MELILLLELIDLIDEGGAISTVPFIGFNPYRSSLIIRYNTHQDPLFAFLPIAALGFHLTFIFNSVNKAMARRIWISILPTVDN